MTNDKIFAMPFSTVYPLYVRKAERKGRSQEEVDTIIQWLTGYEAKGLKKQISTDADFRTFFAQAPRYNEKAALVTGSICGIRVEEVEDPLMRKIRVLDKLIDELSKGKAMEKILRQSVRPGT